MTEIGLTAKVKPDLDDRQVQKEAGKLRSKVEESVKDLDVHIDWDQMEEQVEMASNGQDQTSGLSSRLIQKIDKQTKAQLQSLAFVKTISGALSKLGNMFLKQGGKIALIGLGLVLLSRIADSISKASPLLGQIFDIFSLAMRLFFQPFGNIMGRLLMPLVVAFLDLAVAFNRFMFDVFEDGIMRGVMTLAAILQETAVNNADLLVRLAGLLVGLRLFLRSGFMARIGQVFGSALARLGITQAIRSLAPNLITRLLPRLSGLLGGPIGAILTVVSILDLLFELLFGWSPIFDVLLPELVDLFEAAVDFLLFDLSEIITFLAGVFGLFVLTYEWLVDTAGELLTEFVELLRSLAEGALNLVADGEALLTDLFAWGEAALVDLFVWGTASLNDLYEWGTASLTDLFEWGVAALDDLFAWGSAALDDLFEFVGSSLDDLFDFVGASIDDLFTFVGASLDDLFAFVGANLSDVFAFTGATIDDVFAFTNEPISSVFAFTNARLEDVFPFTGTTLDALFRFQSVRLSELFAWGRARLSDIFGDTFSSSSSFLRALFGGTFRSLSSFVGELFGDTFSNTASFLRELFGGTLRSPSSVLSQIIPSTPSSRDIVSHVFPSNVSIPFSGSGNSGGSSVPLLASGGIVTGTTAAMLGEGGNPEVVMPLNRLGSMLSSVGGASPNPSTDVSPSINTSVSVDMAQEIESELSSEFDSLRAELQNVVSEISDLELGGVSVTADGKVLAEIDTDGRDKYKKTREVNR